MNDNDIRQVADIFVKAVIADVRSNEVAQRAADPHIERHWFRQLYIPRLSAS